MQELTDEIADLIEKPQPRLLAMTDEEATVRPAPGAWSPKEVIGHLIDSAANNHQRFVRGAQDLAADFPGYQQNAWVSVQQYNARRWNDLVDLWTGLNNHLVHVIASLPDEALTNKASVGSSEPLPLDQVAREYLKHMKHHLTKLVSDQRTSA